MAVDLQRLRHMLLTTGAGAGHHQLASAAAIPESGPCYGAAVPSQRQHQPYGDHFMLPPPPTTSPAAEQYSEFLAIAATDLAKKDVSPDGAQEMITKKRRRDEQSSMLGAADVLAAHVQQQTIDIDRILLKHARKMKTTLAEQRQSQTRLIVSAVEARAAKRLKAKDEEIERIRSMNWALEERLRNLFMEAQMWRDVAQSHEATANVLRGDLQRALDVQAVHGGGSGHGQEDDAESCCWGENQVPLCAEEEVGTPVVEERHATGAGRCKGCREGAAVVLLLPCRHLCVCAPCAAAAQACPVCGSAKNGSVCVNFS
ncbi:E3 ubiquitin-protein ligase BOI [Aegilops tauschii subsp. strangulata]|uniref:RING-type domain-containing protein n=1 Tax=Aegilops tauschii subsp. strangulata TaxID=200361 RepID=A0A453ST21_AEGTS|nr:E3 ubiquitin-protein ligase BOI [Aegilops tauschii subsp. strangulata]